MQETSCRSEAGSGPTPSIADTRHLWSLEGHVSWPICASLAISNDMQHLLKQFITLTFGVLANWQPAGGTGCATVVIPTELDSSAGFEKSDKSHRAGAAPVDALAEHPIRRSADSQKWQLCPASVPSVPTVVKIIRLGGTASLLRRRAQKVGNLFSKKCANVSPSLVTIARRPFRWAPFRSSTEFMRTIRRRRHSRLAGSQVRCSLLFSAYRSVRPFIHSSTVVEPVCRGRNGKKRDRQKQDRKAPYDGYQRSAPRRVHRRGRSFMRSR
uniref:Uncharacterized protein n=1 Tax=Trichuris muris TaxID=70415 RepID=A0A5S6PZQ5_TRIMR